MVISIELLILRMSRVKSLISMSPLKISLGYLVFGILWVPATDLLLAALFTAQAPPTAIGLAKSWTFIALSAVLIYLLSTIHRQQMSTAQTKLRAANEQLQVLHRVFRHNIRNDINVIQGYAEILTERLDCETDRDHARAVQQTAEGITAISEKLKMLENVDPTLSDEHVVDLVEIVKSEVEHAGSGNLAVDITTDLPSRAWVECDESIRYAVREVLENAVRHNEKSLRQIHISLDRTDGAVSLDIEDNGPGIPDAELRSLDAGEETALVHASSVGLWLVRWVSQLHDGRVQFDTEDSSGTTVSFEFQAGSRTTLLDAGASVNDRIEAVAD